MKFILEGQADRNTIFAGLAQRFTVRPGKPRTIERTFFDTFDWRLYAAGQRAEEVRAAESVQAEWIENASDNVLGRMNGPMGSMARDWHPAPLAEALARIIKMRALLPLAKITTTRWPADLLDERAKTVVRVFVEISTTDSASPEAAGKAMPPAVIVSAVRGYHTALERAIAVLAGIPGLTRVQHSTLDQVLAMYGRTPLDYSSKINVRLSHGAPCQEAVRTVLARLAEIMAANHNGTAADIDTEFLHDFRVAVRRTRSMLGQMKAAIPAATLKQFRPEFDWLGAVTGPTRDLDVYILKFDDYIAPLNETVRRDLAPLRKHILRRQHHEQRNLSRAITAQRYQALIVEWAKVLRSPWKSGAQSFRGGDPAEAVVGQRILKILKRALRQGRALTDDSPASDVHELRITCKKLRYMMEFFKSLYPPAAIDELTGALKELQDNLGDFQDYEVHRTELYTFAEEMTAQKTVQPRTLLAIGQLAESLAVRQRLARADIGRRFAVFAAKNTIARFRTLFKTSARSTSNEGDCNL